MIGPGSTLGIVGGGQLGRMAALAAARLGLRVHIFCPESDSPAAQVSASVTVAGYDDLAALEAFARAADVVSFEFENIPSESVRALAEHVPVRPSWRVLEVAQDRILEKRFFNHLGLETAPWAEVHDKEDLKDAVRRIGVPSVLKTTRLGYDGKGQVKILPDTDLAQAWSALGTGSPVGILEGFIAFVGEISVIVARGSDGQMATFDPSWNVHRHHILDTSILPAPLPETVLDSARRAAETIAGALDLVGLLAVEMFVTQEGTLLINEMAPRPHNSGHWTMDACAIDQFEQFVRAVCGLPLGSAERHSDAVMTNLIGDDVDRWAEILAEPGACLHLYGKSEAREGRKMGHVTRLSPLSSVKK